MRVDTTVEIEEKINNVQPYRWVVAEILNGEFKNFKVMTSMNESKTIEFEPEELRMLIVALQKVELAIGNLVKEDKKP